MIEDDNRSLEERTVSGIVFEPTNATQSQVLPFFPILSNISLTLSYWDRMIHSPVMI
jgi:hypothetical protein